MQLTVQDIEQLRAGGKVLAHETVTAEGDVIVAVNTTTGQKRVIDTSGLMLECTKRLLLD